MFKKIKTLFSSINNIDEYNSNLIDFFIMFGEDKDENMSESDAINYFEERNNNFMKNFSLNFDIKEFPENMNLTIKTFKFDNLEKKYKEKFIIQKASSDNTYVTLIRFKKNKQYKLSYKDIFYLRKQNYLFTILDNLGLEGSEDFFMKFSINKNSISLLEFNDIFFFEYNFSKRLYFYNKYKKFDEIIFNNTMKSKLKFINEHKNDNDLMKKISILIK